MIVGETFHQIHFIFCACGIEINLCKACGWDALDPGIIDHLKRVLRDLDPAAIFAKSCAIANNTSFFSILLRPRQLFDDPAVTFTPMPRVAPASKPFTPSLTISTGTRQTQCGDLSQMVFAVGREIVSRHAKTCSRNMSLVHAIICMRLLERFFQNIEQTIIANALMIAAPGFAKAHTLRPFHPRSMHGFWMSRHRFLENNSLDSVQFW